jgi:putative aldouronate transport system permease protein
MKKHINAYDIIIIFLLSTWGLIIIYPFYNALLVSLVPQSIYIRNPFMIYPKEITWGAYKYLFAGKLIYSGYKNTLIIVAFGVPYNLFLTTCIGYGLSRPYFPGKKIITSLIIFTMYFGGGLVPFYLLVKQLGLTGSYASVILTSGASTYYAIIMRRFFESIPESLIESAKIDGANDIYILIKIMLPLSKPIIATLCLFFAVSRWNEWFHAMIFMRSSSKWPLQLVLRSIIISITGEADASQLEMARIVFPAGVKMAAIFVTMLPIMVTYPFLQKYFMKGLLIGAVKY